MTKITDKKFLKNTMLDFDENIPFMHVELTDQEHYRYDHYYDMSDYFEFGFLCESKEKTFEIDIKNEELFLNLILKRLGGDRFITNLENDLKNIQKSKTLTFNNTQKLLTYLNDVEYSNTYYLNSVKDLILNDWMDPRDAFGFVEGIKGENDYMMSIMCKYFSKLEAKADDGEVA